jgi:Cellulase (glycosyl hydrolase family 5)
MVAAKGRVALGELQHGHDHADDYEQHDRSLHPNPARRHISMQSTPPKHHRHESTISALLLALVLGLCSGASILFAHAAPAAPARASAASFLGGVNVSNLDNHPGFSGIDGAIAAANDLHAKVVRLETSWALLEPNDGQHVDPGVLSGLDRFVNDASASGIGVALTVDTTPCWASTAPASLLRACVAGQINHANAWPPARPSDYAAIVSFLTRRYGTKLTAIEVWNEPDQSNELYFAGPNKVQRYAAVLRAAYSAIKAANPNVLVLGGSLVGSNGSFLRALYAAGVKGFYDALAVHYYTLTLASLRSIHSVQLANGDRTPLWLDEFGWSSCFPRRKILEEQACVTEAVQAQNILSTLRALRAVSWVTAVLPYDLQDSGVESFGVLNAKAKRKRAFSALSRALTSSSTGPSARVSLRLRHRGNHILASGSGLVGDYVELDVFQGSLQRYRAFLILDRFNRYSVALPAVLGTHGLRVRVYQAWTGIGKATQRSI